MEAEDERISAGDALDRLENRLGGRAIAKATLAELLRDGKLSARAERLFICGVKDLDDAWVFGVEEGVHVAYDFDLDIEQWRDSLQWADDVDLWRWPEGQFLVTARHRPLVRHFFEGVTFPLDEIEFIESDDPIFETSKKGTGGNRPDMQRWENFWMEVVQIARDGNLVPGQIHSQAALRDELLAAMKSRPFSEDSIKDPVRRVWERFCKP